MAGAAPGLRARPSQAAALAAAWACAGPKKAEAMAMEKPEAITIHMATWSGGFWSAAWAAAGAANTNKTRASPARVASRFMVSLLRYEIPAGGGSPVTLVRPGLTLRTSPVSMLLRHRPAHVNYREKGEHKGLQERHKNVQGHKSHRKHQRCEYQDPAGDLVPLPGGCEGDQPQAQEGEIEQLAHHHVDPQTHAERRSEERR